LQLDQGCGRGAAGREGYETLSFQDEREGRRQRKPQSRSEPPITTSHRTKKKRAPDGEVGHALRSAYQRMVEEDIPPEMLDLLGKLG
jgi:hypothetical protein